MRNLESLDLENLTFQFSKIFHSETGELSRLAEQHFPLNYLTFLTDVCEVAAASTEGFRRPLHRSMRERPILCVNLNVTATLRSLNGVSR